MKKILTLKSALAGLGCAVAVNLFALTPPSQTPVAPAPAPFYFEACPGPAGSPAQFVARGRDYLFLISPAGVQLNLQKTDATAQKNSSRTVRLQFMGAGSQVQIQGADELPGKINYLVGNNPAQWHTGLATFARLQVEQLYPGVNLVYYGNQRQLEYDFTVAPGADPEAIKIRFEGMDKISIGAQGELILTLGGDEILQPAPMIYQMVEGARKTVAGGYHLLDAHTVAFRIGQYDHELPLVIDPILSYSTYFGGNSSDTAWSIALDTNGFIYVAGQTLSTQINATNQFSTPGAFRTNYQGGVQVGDAFVAKFDNLGTNLIYLTYLGGSGDDAAYGLAVDAGGHAYVAGATDSANFPIKNGIYTNISGTLNPHLGLYPADGFVAELDPSGSNLVYSTYLGGVNADAAYGIALDSSNNAYVTGFTYSTNFPTTPNAFQKHLSVTNWAYQAYFNANAFVTEISAGGSNLIYSSYLGGTNFDQGTSITVDNSNYVYVTGFTASTNFPTTNAIFEQLVQTNLSGTNQVLITNFFNGSLLNGATNLTSTYDAFVAKFAPSCTSLVYSTFLGGTNYDMANHIAVDGAGNAYVTGWTVSTNFPDTVTGLTNLYNGLTNNLIGFFPYITNAFLTQITWTGTNAAIGYSAVFGGTNFGIDVGYGVALDPSGNVFVVGASSTTNFPMFNTPGLLGTTNAGGSDAFVIAFNTNCSAILYSGYLGGSGNDYGYGIAVDSFTNVYIAGTTFSPNFPVFNARQTSLNGPSDAFLAKIGWTVLPPVITTEPPTNQTVGAAANVIFAITATGTAPLSYQWQLNGTNLVNGGSISGATNASLAISNALTIYSGNYLVIVTNYAGSATSSIAVLTVTNVPPSITSQPTNQTVGVGSTATFFITGFAPHPPYFFQWLKDGTDLTNGTTGSGSIISGATNFIVTITNAQTSDDGGYSIIITNYQGSVTSSVAVLTVVSFPIITVPPTNQTVGLASKVTFVVTAVGAAPLSYQWQVNGTNLVNGGRIGGATNFILTITNAQMSDDGGYSVIVTNSVGSVTSSPPAVLTVLTSLGFTGITVAGGGGGGFILSGGGGTNNGTYFVLTSTNLVTPLSLWTPVATNQFGGQGQFIFTNLPSTNTPQLFYILQM